MWIPCDLLESVEPGTFVITDEDDDFSLMMDKEDLLESLPPEFLRFVLNGETPARFDGVLAGVLGTKRVISCKWWQRNMGLSSELL